MFASMISVYAHNYSSFQEQGIFVMQGAVDLVPEYITYVYWKL